MAILEKEVWVGLSGNNINHFENLGYYIEKYKPPKGKPCIKKGTKLKVKIEDLRPTSPVRVTKICDLCGENSETSYRSLIYSRELGDGIDRCKKCYNKKSAETRRQKYVEKHGSIAEKFPKFAKLLWDKEDSYKYTYNSDIRVDFKCPRCDMKINNKVLSSVFNSGLSCPRCSDGKSYPEKFIAEMLNQIKVVFSTEKTFSWSNNKAYDFYIENFNCIIEAHGKQHYIGGFESYRKGRDVVDEQKNDSYKRNMAIDNAIKNYIEVDCSESSLEYIKQSLLKSKISEMFDLSSVDWAKCHQFACGTIIKQASELWNQGNHTTTTIGNILNVTCNTAAVYLKKGTEIGWCTYDPSESKKIVAQLRPQGKREIVQLSEDCIFITSFESISEASTQTSIHRSNITRACNSRQKFASGFRWMYKEDYDIYIGEQKNKKDLQQT
ncbi:hypothetical protein [Niallia taxi]|uniref:hypothetical protein n=1 Tax=Niallia taxi TaxID=2499688 RepID=UPI0030085233